jgi:hypothetical protein
MFKNTYFLIKIIFFLEKKYMEHPIRIRATNDIPAEKMGLSLH